jgi:hypothetical protein
MAYNISVKFKDFHDRWRWVQRGIALLRDDGLRFNPNETLIYRELAWFFQHKMGQNLDDANVTYKQEWLKEMNAVLGTNDMQFAELLNPQTEEAIARYQVLTNKYKLDPVFMQKLNEEYGPLEWRLPEAHAIYWAAMGLKKAEENPTRIKPDELIQLRRVIYQSMQLSFHRGRLIWDPIIRGFDTGPNLEIIPKVNAAYERAMEEDAENREHISRAHRNFLRDAVYFLYENDRTADALKWFRYIGEKYPDRPMIDGKPDSLPKNTTLDVYATSRIIEDVGETSRDRVKAAIDGQLIKGYVALVRGEDRRSAGYRALARILRKRYMEAIAGGANEVRIGLPPVEETEKQILNMLLDPEEGSSPEFRAALRSALRMEPEAPRPAASTNTPPAAASAQPPAQTVK